MNVLSGCLQPLWPTSETQKTSKGKCKELWVMGQVENKTSFMYPHWMHISIDLLYLLYFKTKLENVYLMKKLYCVIVRGRGQLSVCHPFIIMFCVNPLSLSLSLSILTFYFKANTLNIHLLIHWLTHCSLVYIHYTLQVYTLQMVT